MEDRFVLGVAFKAGYYPALKRGADGRRDIASEDTIEKAAWQYLREMGGRQVGIEHADGTLGHAEVVESYIWRGDPWLIKTVTGQDALVEPGDWLVGLILDDTAWELRKQGLLNGLSPQGRVARRSVKGA